MPHSTSVASCFPLSSSLEDFWGPIKQHTLHSYFSTPPPLVACEKRETLNNILLKLVVLFKNKMYSK